MWGWKTVERNVNPSVSLDEAIKSAVENGFKEHTKNPSHVVLKRPGAQIITMSVAKAPMQLTMAEADSGLFFQLRYDCFAFFDRGELSRVADELAAGFQRA